MNTSLLRNFINPSQLSTMLECAEGEEAQFFIDKMEEIDNTIGKMGGYCSQDGKGGDAIVYLHYFYANYHWFITEKDMENPQQNFAFGFADMGCPELGAISISEVLSVGAELDLHFAPRKLSEVKTEYGY